MIELSTVKVDGRAMRALRGQRTQREFARLIGVSTAPMLSNMERGLNQPSGPQVIRLLILCGAGAVDLVAEEHREELRALAGDPAGAP